jgi:purine-binding chemotaxis protein CheW
MPTKNPAPETALFPLLIFLLGEQHYALTIDDVVEVAAMVELTTVPDAPPEMLGIANRRGTLVPLLDLRRVFKQSNAPVNSATLFIVAMFEQQLIGLVVDEVQQVKYVDPEQLWKTPTMGKYIRGMISHKNQLLQIIALPTLFDTFVTGSTARRGAFEG